MTAQHAPTHPDWLCGVCGTDWPCDPARDALSAEYGSDRVALSVGMSIELHRAANDLRDVPASALYQRFIAWTR